MQKTPVLALVAAVLVVVPAALFLHGCSRDPKALNDSAAALFAKGDNKGALAEYDAALKALGEDRSSTQFLRAAIGRCQALSHVDAKKAADEFIALAKAQPKGIVEGDFSLMANELLRVNTNESRMQAIEVMQAGKALFPESPKLHAIGNAVMASAERADDPASISVLKTLGYVGSGK